MLLGPVHVVLTCHASPAAVGGAFEFTRVASANLREKEDYWNDAVGGFVAGAILGLRCRGIPTRVLGHWAKLTYDCPSTAGRMPRIIGYGAFASVALAAYEFTGGTLKGYLNRPEVDEYERKEMLRQSRRRPIEETLAEIGEGRGESPCCTIRCQVCCDCRSLTFF